MNMHAMITSLLGAALAVSATAAGETGRLWEPVEWQYRNPSWEANPYDVEAVVTFVHAQSGEKRTTRMFYDGGETWKCRFAGTQLGEWSFTTVCSDGDLDGRHGTVTIEPNPSPEATGFITACGSKWARPAGPDGELQAFVPQLVMYADTRFFYRKPGKVDADIKTFIVDHGFNGFHVMGGCHWFDIDKQALNEIRDEDPNPDRRTFEALELLITRTRTAGGMVHIWAWGDDARHWTPTRWGKNGKVDQRLQRYIAARLGPLPGWTMGYGFDNFEWVERDDLRGWHRHLHEQFGWPHLLGARAMKNELTQIYDGLDYSSYEQHRPDYRKYVETIDLRPGKPSFSEDRFRIRQSDDYAYKDYDMDMTRRGLWHSTMAGGVANIWGCLEGAPSELGSKPFARPEWIKTWSTFFRHRFVKDMVRDNALTDGVCLKRPTEAHFVIYREDADSIRADLRRMAGPAPAVAVDAKKPYAPIDIGPLEAKVHDWKAPYRSDWAIAVGRFE